MTVQKVNSIDEYKQLIGRSGLTVVDYYATWCGPCNMIGPKIDDLSEKMKDVSFIKVDVDANPDIADLESVRAMPTLKLFLNGRETKCIVGANFDVLHQAILSHK
ncbi:thioredoxin protein, putative [Cryptosporidium muris RN66]|uniref:Thioredoxin n=1 Tax=Cryptosporidium muris (strain RN66) TaxID=441375 RepID=B6AIQ5_CRYMR|nr:thioredoxin protein, putative [Cryptosporidium muris RN66]EEA08096.1 thioredoxin protein, putative [Cryptosporidium muris RN66]|eukprot:XP_002142445.1 thioredoxin protein [Cryptosporidium muris RN66]